MSRYWTPSRSTANCPGHGNPVDKLLQQWAQERPELDCSSLSVVVRVLFLARCSPGHGKAWRTGPETLEYTFVGPAPPGAAFSAAASELARESMLTSGAMTNRIDRLQRAPWSAGNRCSRPPRLNVCLSDLGQNWSMRRSRPV